jgi:hypothetical protein
MNRFDKFLVLVLLMLTINRVHPQSTSNARSLGMSDSYICLAVGSEAAFFNPANLSFPMRYSTTIHLFGVGGSVANNSLNIKDYFEYTGATLSTADKESFLAKITDENLFINGSASAHAFGFSYKNFALTTQLNAQLYGSISKTAWDLALNGNELNRQYNFVPTEGEAMTFGQIVVSYGLTLPIKNTFIQHAGVGASLKYLNGTSYFDITESIINTTTSMTSADAFGTISARNATGGHGYAVDVGTIMTIKKSRVGIVLKNISSTCLWDTGTKLKKYSFQLEETNAEKIFTGDLTADSLFSTTDTTSALSSFSTQLLTEIHIGYLYPFKKILIAAEVAHQLNANVVVQTPKYSVGLEYRPISNIHIRTGAQLRKNWGYSTSLGFGLLFGIVRWDVAVKLYDAILPQNSKGLSFATSLLLRI